MRVLIEGAKYPISLLTELLGNQLFYVVNGTEGIVSHVGYFHALSLEEVIYFLPKVFYWEGKVFGKFDLLELADKKIEITLKHHKDHYWIRHLLVLFYKSLVAYKSRFPLSEIIEKQASITLNTNIGHQEYTFIDLMLSFFNFYKKHPSFIAFQTVENRSKLLQKPKWGKTVRKTAAIFTERGEPVYSRTYNKKKSEDKEEKLIIIFLSILNHLKTVHQLPVKIDSSFQLYKEKRFVYLQDNGLKILRKIKHKYFSDELKRMYQLCVLYLDKTDKGSSLMQKSEFITVRNYNLVFEDMVDKLFTDDIDAPIQKLKNNADGKIIDHIFKHQSLIDDDLIFYIGDSKYYKPNAEAKGQSLYKQFTYAKNIIQFHIDLFNLKKPFPSLNMRYRDEITEGYNITPNFFIYGFIPLDANQNMRIDFDKAYLNTENYEVKSSYHFEGRLFDRDTLFVHQYQLNFLFILKHYALQQPRLIEKFRTKTRTVFRDNFLSYFNEETKCGFHFFQKEMEENEIEIFVNQYFRLINGKCISLQNPSRLLVAFPTNMEIKNKDLLNEIETFKLVRLDALKSINNEINQ